jgi:hypothetical protein
LSDPSLATRVTTGIAPNSVSKEPPTQSPTMIAGLRRFATSLWLRSVALPQRVPVFGYRRWGRPVVNVIYRVPPRRDCLQHRRYLAATTRESIRLQGTMPAKTDTHDCCPIREHRSTIRIAYRFRLRRAAKTFKHQCRCLNKQSIGQARYSASCRL